MITERALDDLRNEVRSYMSEGRYRHTLGVEKEMRALAEQIAPSLLTEAAAAGLLHDITKDLSHEEQLKYCENNGITVEPDEYLSPALLHAKTGAHFAKTHFPLTATDAVCDAIKRHTVAAMPLSLLATMLYLADFTEEGRTYPFCVALRDALHDKKKMGIDTFTHLHRVLLMALSGSIDMLSRQNKHISFESVKTRDALLSEKTLF